MRRRCVLDALICGLLFSVEGYVIWVAMFLMRQLEIDAGTMRPRRRWNSGTPVNGVPGPWDYWTNGIGDVLALPVMDFAVGAIAYQEGVSVLLATVVALIGIAAACLWYRAAAQYRRASEDIDWWFRFKGAARGWKRKVFGGAKVRVSVAGYIHLVYFALQSAVAALGIWFVIRIFTRGEINVFLAAAGLLGGGGYVIAYLADQLKGHFD